MEPENIAFRAFLRAESAFSPELLRKLSLWDQTAVTPIMAAIREAQDAGSLKRDDPEVVCDILFSLVDGSERWWRWGGDGIAPRRDRTNFFENRWALFLRSCAE